MKSNQDKFLGWALGLFVFFFPFVYSRNLFYGPVNAKVFYAVLGILILTVYFIYHLFILRKKEINSGEKPIKKGKILLWSALGLLLVRYLAAFLGIFWERSLFSDLIRGGGLFYLSLLLFFSYLLSELLTERTWIYLRRAIAFSGGFLSVLSFINPQGLNPGTLSTQLAFSNTTFAANYLVLAFIVTLIEISRLSPSRWRRFFIGLAILQALSPYFTTLVAKASAFAIAGLITYLLGYYLFNKIKIRKKEILLVWDISFVVAVIVLSVQMALPGSFLQRNYLSDYVPARLLVWDIAADVWRQNPWLGVGEENFRIPFEHNFDNRLFLPQFQQENWFDRSHNIVWDTLTASGVIGFLALLFVVFVYWRTVLKASKENKISGTEAILLISLPLVHFVQLQVSFDTVSSYFLLAIILSYVFWLEKEEDHLPVRNLIIPILAVVIVLSGFYYLGTEYTRQRALVLVYRANNPEIQLGYLKKGLSRVSDFESLRISSNSFIRGSYEQIAGGNKLPREATVNQAEFYEEKYREYLERIPTDYRAHLNYANLLIFDSVVLGQNRLEEAGQILTEAEQLSPGNLLTREMEALVYLYRGQLDLAKEAAGQALNLAPESPFAQKVKNHIDKQILSFPDISVLKLENL